MNALHLGNLAVSLEAGSEAQIKAQNDFCEVVRLGVTVRNWRKFEAYCLKATVEEMVAKGVEFLHGAKPKPRFEHDCDSCTFLGTFAIEKLASVDAWLDHVDGKSIILRYSSDEPDYVHFSPAVLEYIGNEPVKSLTESEVIAWNVAKNHGA